MCECVGAHAYHSMYRKSEDSVQGLVLSFYPMGPSRKKGNEEKMILWAVKTTCLVWQTPPSCADAAGESCVSHFIHPGLLSYHYKYLLTLIIMSCCFHSASRGLRLPDSGESRDWCYNGNPLTRCASPQTPSPSPAAQESEIAWLQKALQSQQLRVYLHLTVSVLRRWTFSSNSQHHLKTQTFVGIR